MTSVLGLDIGNDTSVIAAAKQRGVDVLLNDESKRETPSILSFSSSQRLIGSSASSSLLSHPRSTVSNLKRLLSLDPSLLLDLPFPLSPSPTLVRVSHRGSDRLFSPSQLLAMLLSHLRKLAERSLDAGPISDCVIGVPAYFTDAQRRAYLDAAAIAGLRPLRLIQEGAAIALGYGIYRPAATAGPVVFVDVGHCSTQVSIARFDAGKVTMLAHGFQRDLGGRNFDEVLFRHFAGKFRERYGIDVLGNVKASVRLRAACERVKKVLSANMDAPLSVECLMEEIDVNGAIKREEFEELSKELLARIVQTCQRALEDAGVDVGEVHSVELVGSGSRIPAISRHLKEFFGREPRRTLNASECIARGCALQCAMLSPIFRVRQYEVQDSFPFSIGLIAYKDSGSAIPGFILKKGEPIPCTKFFTFHRSKTFDIEAIFATSDELPSGVPQTICRVTIGPFEVPNDGKAKVKVKLRFNLHGILHIEYAYLIKDDTHKPTLRISPDSNPELLDSESSSGAFNGVHIQNNRPTPWNGTEPVEDLPTSVKVTKHGDVVKRRDLEVRPIIFGGMTDSELAEARSLEEELAEKDRIIEEAKEKKNALEAYVYEIRSKILDRFRSFANDSEKNEITEKLQQTEDWLYDDGVTESVQVYTDMMSELEQLVDPIERRCNDGEARAHAMKELFSCIVEYRKVEKSPLPSHVINEILSECQKAENWLREKGKQQELVPKNADPVLWSEEITKKTQELRMTCQRIMGTKPAGPEGHNNLHRTNSMDDMEED